MIKTSNSTNPFFMRFSSSHRYFVDLRIWRCSDKLTIIAILWGRPHLLSLPGNGQVLPALASPAGFANDEFWLQQDVALLHVFSLDQADEHIAGLAADVVDGLVCRG
jgi:hypothetical protein